jgi:hypothetical protein
MLTNKKYNLNDVVSFKLTTGEELIARISEEKESNYMLTKPMLLIPTSNQNIGLAPIGFSFDPQNPVELNKCAVAMHSKTHQELAAQYLQSTTGLTLATS